MRDARCMSLIPQTTLHSDSKQFYYNDTHTELKGKTVRRKNKGYTDG
jgi:hypothetical protein